MTDRDQLGRSEKNASLLREECISCRVRDSSSSAPPETDKSHVVWRRYCALALVLSTLSVLLCAVTWSENASAHRRLLLVEERLKASLTIDDPQLDAKIQALLDRKLVLFPTSSVDAGSGGSSPARSRTIRQVSSPTVAPSDCLCPPGNSSPSSLPFFFYFFFKLSCCPLPSLNKYLGYILYKPLCIMRCSFILRKVPTNPQSPPSTLTPSSTHPVIKEKCGNTGGGRTMYSSFPAPKLPLTARVTAHSLIVAQHSMR